MKPETKYQAALLKLAPFEIASLRLFHRTISKIKIEGRVIKQGIKGQADLYGIVDGGGHIEVELKWIGGTLEPEQETWRDWCLERKIPWLLLEVWKEEEKEATLTRWIAELKRVTEELTKRLGSEPTISGSRVSRPVWRAAP